MAENKNKEIENKEVHIDLVIYQTQQELSNLLNKSKLPLSIIRLILVEVLDSVNVQYDMRINNLTKK